MTDDALFPLPGHRPLPASQATGHYGAGYGDPAEHFGTGGPVYRDEHDHHYQQFRQAHQQQLDEEYAAWRRDRFGNEFERWRDGRQESVAPRHEGALHSLGRAVSDAVTGTREPDLDRLEGQATERFFERS